MLDSYTSTMCLDYWDRLDFARALIDIKSDRPLKDTMVIPIPFVKGSGSYVYTIKVEYEWKLLRCGTYSVFSHDDIYCPKNIWVNLGADTDTMQQRNPTSMKNVATKSDCFQVVKNRRHNIKSTSFKPKSTFEYLSVPGTYKKQDTVKNNGASTLSSSNKGSGNSDNINLVSLRNSFAALNKQYKVFEIVENLEVGNVESKSGEKPTEDSECGGNKETKIGDECDQYDDDEYTTHDLNEQQEAFCDAFDIKLRGRRKLYVIFGVV
ncbi:hypothetical protein Tco_1310313 [Tanacetum coccineum]